MIRRTFIKGAAATAATMATGPLWAMGPEDRLSLGLLRYRGGWNPRPTAIRRLMQQVEKRTSVLVNPDPVEIDASDRALFGQPFVILAGDRGFDPLPEAAILNLRQYLRGGGFLLVESAEGVVDGPFMAAVRRELARVFVGETIGTVPRDHVLYKSFYLIDKPVGRLNVSDTMQCYFDDDRLTVVVSSNDLMGAWERDNFGTWRYECQPGGEVQREHAYRMGINLVMYALCVNYKADQVHVPFILRRRNWKVE